MELTRPGCERYIPENGLVVVVNPKPVPAVEGKPDPVVEGNFALIPGGRPLPRPLPLRTLKMGSPGGEIILLRGRFIGWSPLISFSGKGERGLLGFDFPSQS